MTEESPVLFKALMMARIRNILAGEDFVEFQTPVLRKFPGDRDRPRLRLDDGRWLRESSAYALRANLAYYHRIFELGPMFRPDAGSERHLSEFTMLDLYARDFNFDMALSLAKRIVGSFYSGEMREVSFAGAVLEQHGIDLKCDPDGEVNFCNFLRRHYGMSGESTLKILDRYIIEEIEPLSKGCCLIVTDFSPAPEVRAKRSEQFACTSERFEFQIDGVEVVHGYVDEPDMDALRHGALSYDSLGQEDETMIQLVKSGLVPAESAGFGIGIERLAQACAPRIQLKDFMPSPEFTS